MKIDCKNIQRRLDVANAKKCLCFQEDCIMVELFTLRNIVTNSCTFGSTNTSGGIKNLLYYSILYYSLCIFIWKHVTNTSSKYSPNRIFKRKNKTLIWNLTLSQVIFTIQNINPLNP